MHYLEIPEREQLITQILGARTLAEIAEARKALRAWMQAHPDDYGLLDGFEALAMMQECAETTGTESERPVEQAA